MIEYSYAFSNILGPLVVGLILWILGETSIRRKNRQDAIRDLMSYRNYDRSSTEFTKALNKISIIFHNDEEIRADIRRLYELINSPANTPGAEKRAIVGILYKLCQCYGFKGLSEYDIDQAIPDSTQAPPEG